MLRQYEAPLDRRTGGLDDVGHRRLDLRPAVQALSLVVTLLAVLILVTGSVGLLSLMMVEVLSLFLSSPLTALVMPIFRSSGPRAAIELTGPVITPPPVAAGVAAAPGVGLLGSRRCSPPWRRLPKSSATE